MAILLLLLAACTQVDSFTPTITAVAANNCVNDRTPLALPFRMCDVPAHFTDTDSFGPLPDPVVFILIGSGFMPQVAKATESGGTYRSPLVALEGPATYQAVGSGVLDPERISVQLDYGDQAFADGLYAVSVRNPDDSETVTARLANAVQIIPPPRAAPSVASVCLIHPPTVVFRGGPFVPGLRATASASQPDPRFRDRRRLEAFLARRAVFLVPFEGERDFRRGGRHLARLLGQRGPDSVLRRGIGSVSKECRDGVSGRGHAQREGSGACRVRLRRARVSRRERDGRGGAASALLAVADCGARRLEFAVLAVGGIPFFAALGPGHHCTPRYALRTSGSFPSSEIGPSRTILPVSIT
jgi:hypothetical protein